LPFHSRLTTRRLLRAHCWAQLLWHTDAPLRLDGASRHAWYQMKRWRSGHRCRDMSDAIPAGLYYSYLRTETGGGRHLLTQPLKIRRSAVEVSLNRDGHAQDYRRHRS